MFAFVPPDLIAGVVSGLFVLGVALAVALSRLAVRISRIEEWIRLYERKNGN